jgi:hypothetical protein
MSRENLVPTAFEAKEETKPIKFTFYESEACEATCEFQVQAIDRKRLRSVEASARCVAQQEL